MLKKLRYLLLQVRNSDDPMRAQEVDCFARALKCDRTQIQVFDLLSAALRRLELDRADMVLLGGSGHYSVASEGEWLQRALGSVRQLHEMNKPTFASCWGFQAMARALGGNVTHDPERAELGTHQLRLTEAGRADPVFGVLGEVFEAQMGHADRVSTLPPGSTRLASTDLVENQAYRFDDRPIYCTQFHPELNAANLLQRVEAYPEYIRLVTGMTMQQFAATCKDTALAESLLMRFVQHVFG